MLQIFDEFCFSAGECFLFSMDIKYLYTVTPNNDGLHALAHFLDNQKVKEPSTATFTCLAELLLTLNAFSFNGNHYRQVSDVAMSSKMGPNYTCSVVAVWSVPLPLCTFFEKCGYSSTPLDHKLQQVSWVRKRDTIQDANIVTNSSERIPLVLTYHPFNNHIKKILLSNFNILMNEKTTKEIFPLPP